MSHLKVINSEDPGSAQSFPEAPKCPAGFVDCEICAGTKESPDLPHKPAYSFVERTVESDPAWTEFVVVGPTSPQGETVLAVNSESRDAVESARRTAGEVVAQRNRDIAFGEHRAFARVNAALGHLVDLNASPLVIGGGFRTDIKTCAPLVPTVDPITADTHCRAILAASGRGRFLQ